jgi:phosphopantetheinyl transferase (holo-ACP synthase)
LLDLLKAMGDVNTKAVTSNVSTEGDLMNQDEPLILPRSGQVRRRPWVFLGDGKPLRRYLSIAHLPTAVVVAAASRRIGIDLVDLSTELHSSFGTHWFNTSEVERLGSLPLQIAWAAKEATYKAICRRQQFRPRHLTIASVLHNQSDAETVMVVRGAARETTTRGAIVTILYRGPFAIALATAEPRSTALPAAPIMPFQVSAVCETTRPTGYTEYSVTTPDLPAAQSQATSPSTRQSD